jgi:hypothetical protein
LYSCGLFLQKPSLKIFDPQRTEQPLEEIGHI